MFHMLWQKKLSLHTREACTAGSNIILSQILITTGFAGRIHYTSSHFSFLPSLISFHTQNIKSLQNGNLRRLLLGKNVFSKSCTTIVLEDALII